MTPFFNPFRQNKRVSRPPFVFFIIHPVEIYCYTHRAECRSAGLNSQTSQKLPFSGKRQYFSHKLSLCNFKHQNTLSDVLSREQILTQVWGYQYMGETNVVDVYVRYLRNKIDDPYDKKLLHTIRGVGYVLRDDV